MPLDLHVLGLSLAFILSQDQTLRCYISTFSFFFFYLARFNFRLSDLFHPEQVLFLLDEFPLFLQSCFPCAYCLSLSQLFQCSLYFYALKSQHSLAFPLKSECKINTFFQTEQTLHRNILLINIKYMFYNTYLRFTSQIRTKTKQILHTFV